MSSTSGIYVSTNQGAAWQVTGLSNIDIQGNAVYRWAGERLLVDPFDSSNLWFGSRSSGLHYSSDYGKSWKVISTVPYGKSPVGVSFVIAGRNQSILYVGVYGSGIYHLNGTNSFALMHESPSLPVRGSVAVDGTLFITSDVGIHRFKDNQWTTSTPDTTTYCGLSTDPVDPKFIIASTIDQAFDNPYFISVDGGDNWKKYTHSDVKVVQNVPWWPNTFYAAATSAIVIDPHNSSNACMSDWYGVYFTNNLKSSQPVWETHEIGHEEVVVLALVSHPTIPIISGTADVGGFVHNDIYSYPKNSTRPLDNTVSIDFSEGHPNIIARSGATSHFPSTGQPGGCYSTDAGNTWNYFDTQIGNGGRLAVSATTNRIVYIPINESAHYSDNYGTTWSSSQGVSIKAVPTTIWTTSVPFVSDRVDGNT